MEDNTICGIHFVLNNDTYVAKADDFLKDAFFANQVRGTDSCGVLQVVGNNLSVMRQAVNGSTFIEHNDVKNALRKATTANLTLCHVRAATHGKVNTNNAHPFSVFRDDGSRLVGVHNGTLYSWHNHEKSDKFDVDSEWALNMIAEHGAEAFKYFDGAFAFVWYDEAHPDSVFMARNDQRPLHYIVSNKGKTLLGASEAGMLGWLAERRGFKLHDEKDMDKLYSLSPGFLYEFSLKSIGRYNRTELPKFDKSLLPTPTKINQSPYLDEDYYDDTLWGYPVTNRGGYRQFGGQTSIIQEAKAALRKARYAGFKKVENKEKVITNDDLEDGTTAALEKEVKKVVDKEAREFRSPFVYLNHYVKYINTSTALEKEREAAGTLRSRVVDFSGVYYDKETARGYGYVEIQDTLGNVQNYDAEIRAISEQQFNLKFLNERQPAPLCAIIGVNKRGLISVTDKFTPTFILTELDAQTERLVLEAVDFGPDDVNQAAN